MWPARVVVPVLSLSLFEICSEQVCQKQKNLLDKETARGSEIFCFKYQRERNSSLRTRRRLWGVEKQKMETTHRHNGTVCWDVHPPTRHASKRGISETFKTEDFLGAIKHRCSGRVCPGTLCVHCLACSVLPPCWWEGALGS